MWVFLKKWGADTISDCFFFLFFEESYCEDCVVREHKFSFFSSGILQIYLSNNFLFNLGYTTLQGIILFILNIKKSNQYRKDLETMASFLNFAARLWCNFSCIILCRKAVSWTHVVLYTKIGKIKWLSPIKEVLHLR